MRCRRGARGGPGAGGRLPAPLVAPVTRRAEVIAHVYATLDAPGDSRNLERARLRLFGQAATVELAERAEGELDELLATLPPNGPR